MLDQSFSSHNLELIYSLESRKGNIDITTMPETYLALIKQAEEVKREVCSLKTKKDRTQDEDDLLLAKKELLTVIAEEKKINLQNYLEGIEEQINSHDFKFTLKKFVAKNGKEVFKLDTDSHVQLFAIKQLQYNIRHTFKVKQANRHNILANIKTFLNCRIPLYVIRTDISSFYESIPHQLLLPKVFNNTLLSYKSKAFIKGILREYESLKDTTLVAHGCGVPRGIGISSYLSELYMRDLDAKIVNKREVMFYARYVDDIFLILTAIPSGKELSNFYKDLTDDFASYGLLLKQPNDASGKCSLLDFTKDHTLETMTYLGYSLNMKRQRGCTSTTFSLSDKKKDRYKKKIDNAIDHFNTLSKCDVKQAYHDLLDALNLFTGNIKLFKSKSGVKVGLYYSNDLLDNMEDLDLLTDYLHKHSVNPYIGLKDRANIIANLSKRIQKINFTDRWKTRKMFSFSLQRVQELEKWL